MREPSTPILVGCSQYVNRGGDVKAAPSPQEMMAAAAAGALADTGVQGVTERIDTIAAIRTFADSAPQFASPFGQANNYPAAIAKRIGAAPRRHLYPVVGGNTPQMMVNLLAEDIRIGRAGTALIVGAEALKTAAAAAKARERLDWSESYREAPVVVGALKPGVSPHELRHGLGAPTDTYPLFENALAHHYRRSPDAHRAAMGELFARFSQIAADNPYSAVSRTRSAEEIATPSRDNRLIAWPYTKFMNANMFVDQAAAVLLTNVETAKALGIAEDRWIYLSGSADIDEKWLVSERVNYHSAPAIAAGCRTALGQAGVGVDEIAHFDLYSCFPSAVEVAIDALKLASDDPRGFTVTGGLPFFGGPGNNYSLHAIAEMMCRLRKTGGHGLVTANGWYLTKHSMGVYSAEPPQQTWRRLDPADPQAEIDRLESPPFTEIADGPATLETFTVTFSRKGPKRAIMIGRLVDKTRFLANGPGDTELCNALMAQDPIGLPLTVRHEKGRNIAVLA